MKSSLKILVIDGQGGKLGQLIISQIKERAPETFLTAVGTNSIATSAMLKAGADIGATGENPIIVNSKKADIIVGPIGIVLANSLLGEITPATAAAVGGCEAKKILIPSFKCNIFVTGVREMPLSGYISAAVDEVISELTKANADN